MCLTVHLDDSYKIAKKNITCYKVFSDIDNNIYSPYTSFKWELNELTKAIDKPYILVHYDTKSIFSGYFHTFKTIKGAKKEISTFLVNGNYYPIYKCVIPKGTKYWEGVCYNGCKGFASKKLIVESNLQ